MFLSLRGVQRVARDPLQGCLAYQACQVARVVVDPEGPEETQVSHVKRSDRCSRCAGGPRDTVPKEDGGIGLLVGKRTPWSSSSGPIGPPGLGGLPGEAGVKGQKGDPGETPNVSSHRVAFTARRTTNSATSTSGNTRLPFDETETLLPGTSFDLATGTFTCDVP
ncbi:complement C1q subcomponent subunit B-like, partial [Acanthaster planci]|uniref:Complement C1q subcomponent subunit B-like n=1 Tax=Acanthaster planci TaxID=133434 RepID=A0A8B8A0I8_ACAPL